MAHGKRMACLTIFLSLMMSSLSVADNMVELLPLEPLPPESIAAPFQIRSQRMDYNKKGRIDRINEDEIVINDTLRYMSPSTRVFSSSDSSSIKRILRPGQWVEYNLDNKNTILKIRVMQN